MVQLVQGERLAIKDDDVFRWVRRFEKFPRVQVIDLDAALGAGDNLALVRRIAASISCRVGGGIRTIDRARDVLAAGARQIIAGSALFKNDRPDLEFASRLADAYSGTCLSRVWRSTHFSWWMTTMLHRTPGADPMEAALQLSQLRYVTTSRAAAVALAENYVGYPPLR